MWVSTSVVNGERYYIAQQTDDGRELVDALLDIVRTDDQPKRVIDACLALLDRYAGRPLQSHEVLSATVTLDRPPASWDSLSLDEKRAAIAERLARGPVAALPSGVDGEGDQS